MPWTHYAALFVGGALLANALPHLVAGVLGKPLQTPFASPPFRGLSSPRVNVIWALINLLSAYLLLVWIASMALANPRDAGSAFAGFAAWAFIVSRSFARVRKDRG